MNRDRLTTAAACLAAGLLLAFALPPWGWWPLSFAGIAVLDQLLADQPVRTRFARSWLAAAALFFPTTWWVQALSLPGYFITAPVLAAMVAAACAACPPNRLRWLALPAAIVVEEALRARWPFEGVPLSTLAHAQVSGPLAPVARVGGSLLLIGVAVATGLAVSAAWQRSWRAAGALTVAVVAMLGLAIIAPDGEATGSLDVALVQGGGPQGTRAIDTDPSVVFRRHVQAMSMVPAGIDLVVWPEDVVDVDAPIGETAQGRTLAQLARQFDVTLVAGVVESVTLDGKPRFRNAAVAYDSGGAVVARFEKVHRVPFGEYVPLRSLLEKVAAGALIQSEAIVGEGPAVLDTPAGRLGVVISWEVFFGDRGRDAIGNGGTVLLNPTNGASYRGTLVQTQQIAASRLRAIETGRWTLQTAPTGLTAIITAAGRVVERSGVSEARVVTGTVETREGETIYVKIGDRPVIALGVMGLALAWALDRTHRPRRSSPPPDEANDQLGPEEAARRLELRSRRAA